MEARARDAELYHRVRAASGIRSPATLVVAVTVVQVRIVRVRMHEPRVPVPMTVRLAGRIAG